MDQIWTSASEGESTEKAQTRAMIAFDKCWTEQGFTPWSEFTLEDEQRMTPRTPGVAADMFACYIDERWGFMKNQIKLLGVERPFCVPLGLAEIFYVGRRDKDFELHGRVIAGEHKTTTAYKKDGGFRYDYLESWSPNSQVDGYLHSLHMDYGKKAQSVWIDAALVHKTVHDKFRFIPIDRMFEHLEGWLYDVRNWIARIIGDEMALTMAREEGKNDGDSLSCFPKNTEECYGKYGACSYVDICKFVSNPETLSGPPDEFMVEKWEPFDILKLGKIEGLEPEDSNPNVEEL
jgi:hypothetical protein